MSHGEDAALYVEEVLSGKIEACKFVKQACERQKRDLVASENAPDTFPYEYQPELGEKVCDFIELLPHIKGAWAGKPLILEPWQKFILCTVFGWVRKENGKRRFRTVYIEVPRKNAKSTLTSGVALYMLAADQEGGAEVYSAATTRDQAQIVFRDAWNMSKRSRGLLEHLGVEVHAHSIIQPDTASKFVSLAAEANSMDGLNVHFGGIDELHAHKDRRVFDVIETATGSRLQSLLWLITTAGFNRAGVCYEQRLYLAKLLERSAYDETYFGIVYTLDDGDDWTDPRVWAKANPNYNVSVYPDDIKRLADKAKEMASAQNNFLTKRLNVWVNAGEAWMNMVKWDACKDESLDLADYEGEPCYVGVDLASKVDVAAVVLLFPRDNGEFHVFGRYYLPEDTVEERAASTTSHYSGWARAGLFTLTPGNVIDFDVIGQDILEISSRFAVQEIGFDPWQSTQMANQLATEGASVTEYRNTVGNMSEPMKQLEALVVDGKLKHNGDQVLTWMASNVTCQLDAKDNIYPRKERPENKIDGIIALIMALGLWIQTQEEPPSYLEGGNMLVL